MTIRPRGSAPGVSGVTVGGVPRPLRSDLPDGILHVTTRGVWNRLVYLDDDDCRGFLGLLAVAVKRLFGARFAAWVVRDEEHYGRTLEYVLTNPVRAGLVEDWTDWPWSAASGATNP